MWESAPKERSPEPGYVQLDDLRIVERRAERRSRFQTADDIVDPWSFAAKTGRGTIHLALIEYRILRFLAARPNRAFSRSRIAQAVSTKRHRVTPETLGRYIRSLRDQLGFFSDYIQSVPYIGYRFKG